MPHTMEQQIDSLKSMIQRLGAEVENRLDLAADALLKFNAKKAQQVIDSDDEINQMEVDLEEECLKVLALYQPVAVDLRTIISILKINNDLERIADMAVNIAQRATFLSTRLPITIPPEIEKMSRHTKWMLKASLDSLIDMNSELAREVLERDDEVDQLKRDVHEMVAQGIQAAPDRLPCLIEILLVARHFERAADLGTNIAEDVIYLVEGEIVRHIY